jgi:hypothetical protein
MKRNKLHIALWKSMLLTVLSLTVAACSDTLDDPNSLSGLPGTVSLSVSSSRLALTASKVGSRADGDATQDPEFYMGTVDLFFYAGELGEDDWQKASPVCQRRGISVNTSSLKELTLSLGEKELNDLFPDGADACTVYAVANAHTQVETLLQSTSNPTIAELKAIALNHPFYQKASSDGSLSDFAFDLTNTLVPMDGTAALTLNTTDKTVSGNIVLQRSIAKVQMDLNVDKEVKVLEEVGKDSVTYVPEITGIKVALNNAATQGLLDGEATEHGYTSSSSNSSTGNLYYSQSYTQKESEKTDQVSLIQEHPFYSYPNSWTKNAETGETTILLLVPWKKKDVTEYSYYYYQISLSSTTLELLRNHYYHITLHVARLGSTTAADPVKLDQYDYEIMDWGEDETSITAELSNTHYLVVEDNQFTIYNQDAITFDYLTCSELQGVYLTEVSYESTAYTKSNGDPDSIYLYKTNANFEEDTSVYTGNSATARTTYSAVVDSIKKIVKNNTVVVDTPTLSANGETTGEGKITFTAKVSNIASKLYRPVKYKLVLVNDAKHEGLRYTVTIVQYPPIYAEFGASGNVFVNGYYARLKLDDDKETTKTAYETNFGEHLAGNGDYWKSYDYTTTYSDSEKYYSTSSISNKSTDVYLYAGDYDYVRIYLDTSGTIQFTSTVDVTVTAFSSDANTFTTNSGNNSHTYILGNPLVNGEYTSSSLEKYLTKCEKRDSTVTVTTTYGPPNNQHTTTTTNTYTYYYRYVSSWGDKAEEIKVGCSDDNIIAPRFKIQSGYGAAKQTVNFENGKKRCATYQEAGYPAGRWRIPTLAEIAFIVKLQNAGVINNMFKSDNTIGYWTASGGYIVPTSAMTYTSNTSDNHYIRCVYDLWYWGDKQTLPTHYYHPCGTDIYKTESNSN